MILFRIEHNTTTIGPPPPHLSVTRYKKHTKKPDMLYIMGGIFRVIYKFESVHIDDQSSHTKNDSGRTMFQ